MPPLLFTVALALALFIGAGAGYYVRYLHALSKRSSLELRLKERELEAEGKAIAVIERAEEKAEAILQDAKQNQKPASGLKDSVPTPSQAGTRANPRPRSRFNTKA